MNFDQLNTFLAVSELGSYQKASELLYLSQPAITHRINQLEDELGVTLFIRGKKEIRLTQEGTIFMKHAESIMQSFSQVFSDLELFKRTARGKLSMACSRLYSAYIMPHILNPLIERFPDIEIMMRSVPTKEALTGLDESIYDFVIMRYSVHRPDLVFHLIREEKFFLAVAKNHRFAMQEKVSIKEVLKEPLILPQKGTQVRELFDMSLSKYGTDYYVQHESDEVELTKNLTSNGLGLTFLVKSANEMNPVPLAFVDLEEEPFPLRPTYLVHKKGELNPQKELYIDTIKEIWK